MLHDVLLERSQVIQRHATQGAHLLLWCVVGCSHDHGQVVIDDLFVELALEGITKRRVQTILDASEAIHIQRDFEAGAAHHTRKELLHLAAVAIHLEVEGVGCCLDFHRVARTQSLIEFVGELVLQLLREE